MRVVVILLALIVVAAIVALYTGMLNFNGHSGSMPKIAVQGGSLPSVSADVGSIDLGTKNTTVEVPKVQTETKTVSMPTIGIRKAGEK